MTSAAEKIARLDRSIARAGDIVTLRRIAVDESTGALSTLIELTCPAHVRASAPQDLLDSAGVTSIKVVLSATYLQAPVAGSTPVPFGIPLRDDRLLIAGEETNVEHVAPILYRGALVRVNLLCRGGGG